MHKNRVATTKEQREAIKRIKRIFGERGYFVFPLSAKLRRHRQDFVALPKHAPTHFILVRPTRNKGISLQPYCETSVPKDLKDALTPPTDWKIRILWKNQLPMPKKNPLFKKLLSPKSNDELRQLLFIEAHNMG